MNEADRIDMNKLGCNLPLYEWEFSGIPEVDLITVWSHELQRERVTYERETGQLKEEGFKVLENALADLEDDGHHKLYGLVPIQHVAWAKLSLPQRESLRFVWNLFNAGVTAREDNPFGANRPFDRPVVCLDTISNKHPKKSLETYIDRAILASKGTGSSLHLFEFRHIDGMDTRRGILKAFSKWLHATSPYSELPLGDERGRPEDPRKRLFELGVYRLKKTHNRPDVCSIIFRESKLRTGEGRKLHDSDVSKISKDFRKQVEVPPEGMSRLFGGPYLDESDMPCEFREDYFEER